MGWFDLDASCYLRAGGTILSRDGLRLAPLPARPLRRRDFNIDWYSVFRRHLGMEWNILVTAIFNRSDASVRTQNGLRCILRPSRLVRRRQFERSATRRHVGVGWLKLDSAIHDRSVGARRLWDGL